MSQPNAASPSASSELIGSWVRGALGGLSALGLELFFTLLPAHEQVSSIWELQSGLALLSPALVLPSLGLGALGGLGWGLCQRGAWKRGLLLPGVSFALLVGYGVGGGRHLATPALRLAFAAALALVAAGGLSLGLRWLRRRRLARCLQFAGLASVILLAALLNRWVLVRLYPAFHAGLSALSLMVAGALYEAFAPRRPAAPGQGRQSLYWLLAWSALLGVALAPASRWARGYDNFRSVLSEGSPTLALGVELASRIAPPPPLDPRALEPLGRRKSEGSGLDLSGRSILLITVDALRADHLGAYGYQRPTSPAFDALAARGVLFEAAYAATPHTSYSVTSLLTGKYMRPLLLQGAGQDSDLWARLLQNYGVRTAAFYPPAVFFIDGEKFQSFSSSHLGFEYAKVEFAEGEKRVGPIEAYLKAQPEARPLFLWLHLFGPHEPYVKQKLDFGERDLDRYDSEIAAADETIGKVSQLFRARDPKSLLIVTADHGEEFGEHGGRYHGSSVFEEQVRVPLLFQGEGLPEKQRVAEPVQTVDLLPTVLEALRIPVPPRIRGNSLLAALKPGGKIQGFAAAETDEYSLLAEGKLRLVCARRTGSCQLFDLAQDPLQTKDLSAQLPEPFQRLRDKSRALAASHGQFETQGLRAEGKGWPPAIIAGIAGDADSAPELARLLDDADRDFRRKAAELLFELGTTAELSAMRLALSREEDALTRKWLHLGLARRGEKSGTVFEILAGPDRTLARAAALALAEQGDARGEALLLAWFEDRELSFEQKKTLVAALSQAKCENAVPLLVKELKDVRLRPLVATALGTLGDKTTRLPLLEAAREERYQSARLPLLRALAHLGAKEELEQPLITYLGMPEPLAEGLPLASELGLLEKIGGPKKAELKKLRELASSGLEFEVDVPRLPGAGRSPAPGTGQVRVLAWVRAQAPGGLLQVAAASQQLKIVLKEHKVSSRNLPVIPDGQGLSLQLSSAGEQQLDLGVLPEARPGQKLRLVAWASEGVEVQALVALPLRPEFPPPPPQAWKPDQGPEEQSE